MSGRKIIVALVIILVAIGGFVAGLFLLQERQELRDEAAVPGGQATVSLEPTTGNYEVGDTIQASVFFNTANIAVNGVAVRLTYAFSGATPEVTVTSIDINPTILTSGEWNCPTKNATEQGSDVVIDIACVNDSAFGFTSTTDTLLANITLNVEREPGLGALTLRFVSEQSIITQKTTGEDILLIPASTGNFTIGGSTVTGTPILTATSIPTASPTPTKFVTSTPTPTRALTATPTTAQLPDAGVSYPTIVGLGVGILVIMGGLLLAF